MAKEDINQKENTANEQPVEGTSEGQQATESEAKQPEAEATEDQQTEAEKPTKENTEGKEASGGKTAELELALTEQKDKYLRLYSDFENFRRRNAKEKLDLVKTASENLMVSLLPVLDDFDRTLEILEKKKDDKEFQQKIEQSNELKAVIKGIGFMHNKFLKALQASGLKHMDANPGDPFDPDLQEAVTQIPVEDEKMKGKLVDVIEKGYLLEEKVIRYAKVVTGA